jgi:hypothetical protein
MNAIKITRYVDIPSFTRWPAWTCHAPWTSIFAQLEDIGGEGGLDLSPDFQREHVWSEEQQVRYVEFCLRGGRSSRDVLFNCVTWNAGVGQAAPAVLVDGKQRLEAVRRFLKDEIRVFGSLRSEFEGKLSNLRDSAYFKIYVNDLPTRADVLRWYLDLNDGGVVHTREEIDRVRELLRQEPV